MIRSAPRRDGTENSGKSNTPRPITATLWPGRALQVFITVPTPVITRSRTAPHG